MKKAKQLRIGVIGHGFMGKMHLDGLARIERSGLLPARVEAISGANVRRGNALARKIGCRYIGSGAELIHDDAVDVVVIASPTDSHLEYVREVVRAGKPVFLEKPLGRDLAEANKIATLLRKSSAPHQIGLVLRFSPTYNVLRRLIGEKRNGRLVFCHFRDDQFFPFGGIYGSTWRADPSKSGGGTLIEHSIHDIDAMRWLFGEPKVTDAVVLPSHVPGIEKLAALNMRFGEGAAGQLSSIWHENHSRENERNIEIFFEKRYFQTLGGFTSPIFVQGPKGEGKTIGSDEIQRRFRAMRRWRDKKNTDFPATIGYQMYVFLKGLLAGKRQSEVEAGEGLAAHRLIETAYRMGRKR